MKFASSSFLVVVILVLLFCLSLNQSLQSVILEKTNDDDKILNFVSVKRSKWAKGWKYAANVGNAIKVWGLIAFTATTVVETYQQLLMTIKSLFGQIKNEGKNKGEELMKQYLNQLSPKSTMMPISKPDTEEPILAFIKINWIFVTIIFVLVNILIIVCLCMRHNQSTEPVVLLASPDKSKYRKGKKKKKKDRSRRTNEWCSQSSDEDRHLQMITFVK